jgi:hypothetical protein
MAKWPRLSVGHPPGGVNRTHNPDAVLVAETGATSTDRLPGQERERASKTSPDTSAA